MDKINFHQNIHPLKRENKGYCIFCNTQLTKKNTTREHVIAEWLIEYLNIRELEISPTIYNPLLEKNTAERNFHTLNNFRAGSVCKTCNEGWMSQLEIETMDVLKKLIYSSIEIKDIPTHKKNILAKWIFKTILVLNTASNFYKNIPGYHYKDIFEGSLPGNLLITATPYLADRPYKHFETSAWTGENTTIEELKEIASNAYKVSLQLGNIIFMVAYCPDNNWKYNLVEDIHKIIHKPEKMNLDYYSNDNRKYFYLDSENATLYVALNLEISKR